MPMPKIPTSHYGRGYKKDSVGTDVFAQGGGRMNRIIRPSAMREGSLGVTINESLFGPNVSDIAATTVTVSGAVIINTGTVFVVIDTDTGQPTPIQMRNGLNALGGAADFDGTDLDVTSGLYSVAGTGLVTATLYFVWAMHSVGNQNSPVQGTSFTTL